MKIGYIVGLVLVIVLGLGAAALAANLVQREQPSETGTMSSQPDTVPTTPAESASVPEAADVGDKEAIQERVNTFVAIYYGRSTDLYEGSLSTARERLADQLKPYVTESFLVGYLPPLDTPPDMWNKRTGAEVLARVKEASVIGHFEDSEAAEETLRVVITPVVDGIKQQPRTIDIALALVREDGAWRVDKLEELYL